MKRLLIITFLFISVGVNAMIFYVSTTGSDSNPGTLAQPFGTWAKGVSVLSAGDTLYIRGGTYRTTQGAGATSHSLWQNISGTADNMIKIWAYPGESPVFNLDNITMTTSSTQILDINNCDYLWIKGLRITGLAQQPLGSGTNIFGMVLENSEHNIIELVEIDHLGMYGMCFGNGANYNYIKNCDAHHLADLYSDPDPYGGANGFNRTGGSTAHHLTFDGCRAWLCSDDGWDLFRSDGEITLKNCWAFWNGYLDESFSPTAGNGVGFKLGPGVNNTSAVTRILENCLAFQNKEWGFNQNFIDGAFASHVYNCVAYDNKAQGFIFTWGPGSDADIFRNNIGYKNIGGSYIGDTGDTSDHNTWDAGAPGVSTADFISVDPTGVNGPREADGSLPVLDFLKLASTSDLIDAGVNVGLTYAGMHPDIGAYEFTGENHSPSIIDQSFEIDENSPDGTVAGTVVASDPDMDQTIAYSLVSGNTDGAFAINASTGVISVANSAAINVDFALVVKVMDNGTDNLSSQATITINVIPTGIESTGSNSTIKVYPNPVTDELIIEIEGYNDRQGIEILDSIGDIIFKGDLTERTTVPTTNFSSGVYLIKLQNNKTFEFKKVVKL